MEFHKLYLNPSISKCFLFFQFYPKNHFQPFFVNETWQWGSLTMFYNNGYVKFSGSAFVDNEASFGETAGYRAVIEILNGKAAIGAHSNNLNAWSNLVINSEGGFVGIGTIKPAELVSFSCKIRAREIKAETASLPDYVFTKSYQPPSLTEVETCIKANNHLPEIPSEADGISLGEMNVKLLKEMRS